MRRLILVATLLLAGFVGLHSVSATPSAVHAAVATHATLASAARPMCGGIPGGC